MARPSEIHQAALQYWRRGWSIFPVKPGSKRAAVRWKRYSTDRASEARIDDWFRDTDRGIGVIFGAVSGNLVCRDFDDMPTYESWAEKQPELAETLPTVVTARGRHVYATASDKHVQCLRKLIGNPNGKGAITVAGGELRCGVSYTILPPSVHESGHVYKWLVPLPAGALPEIDLFASDFHALQLNQTEPNGTDQEDFSPSFPPKGRRECPTVDGSNPCNREHRENRGERRLQKRTEAIVSEGSSKQNATKCDTLKKGDPRGWSEAVQWAIVDSVPEGPGKRHKQVFELARGLKAIPELSDANPQQLKPYVRQWHKLSKDKINTKPFEETWIDFLKGWPNVRFPKGGEPMVAIFERANRADLPESASEYDQDKLRLLVALCRELQRSAGSGPFFLSCRTAGRLLGVDHTTANRWLYLLSQDGLLEITEPGDRGRFRATRYRYLGEL